MQNENSEILAELKKINSFNSSSKKYGIAFIVVVGLTILFDVYTKVQEKKHYENQTNVTELPLWLEIQKRLNSDDINGAIEILKKSVDNNPDNYYNQGRLAEYYMRAKNYGKALEHYKKAYSLFPHDDYKEMIEIVEKLVAKNS